MTPVEVECQDCDATGIIRRFGWPPGSFVVCDVCDGTGCSVYYLKVFEGRRTIQDVVSVHESRDLNVKITYEEFLKRVKE